MLTNLMLPACHVHTGYDQELSVQALDSGSTFASAISQRQKEWGTSDRSVAPLHSVQDATRRLQCDVKPHSRVFPLCFTPHSRNFMKEKNSPICQRDNPCWTSPSRFTLATSSAEVKCDFRERRGAGVCIVQIRFLGRYYLYICTFDWI